MFQRLPFVSQTQNSHNVPWFDLMPIDTIIIIIIGATFGGLVNGLAGFGTGLFALGWWLQVLPPTLAVALVVILSFVSGVQGAFAVRQALNWLRLRRFLIPAIAGLPFGFAMLDDLNTGMLKLLVGSLLALFGGFFILRPRFVRWQRNHMLADISVAFWGHLPACLVPCQQYGVPFMTGKKANSAPYYNRLMCWFWASSCWCLAGAACCIRMYGSRWRLPCHHRSSARSWESVFFGV